MQPNKILYNVNKDYRRIAVSSMQIKQEMLVYDTLIIMDRLGLLKILQLKGGHCARCYLPVSKHRYSNDLDFNLLEPKEKNIKKIYELLPKTFNSFCHDNNLDSGIKEEENNSIFILTRSVESGRITNNVVVEINKKMPYLKVAQGKVKTFLDLNRVGYDEVVANVFTLEELLGEKLYICGRPNGHRDAYDIYRTTEKYPQVLDGLPELTIHRFLQRCELRKQNPQKMVKANKKALMKWLNLPGKIRELKQMSFEKIDSNFIREIIRVRVFQTLDLLLRK